MLVRSDNGSEWAKDFVELLNSYFVHMRKIKPGHSRANGMAERMVQTVKTYLDKYLRTFPALQFDDALGMIEMIINALPSTATGLSPYFVEMGREFRLPFLKGLIKKVDIDSVSFSEMTIEEYATRRADQVNELIKLVAERLSLTITKTMRKYAKKYGHNEVYRFKPGDHVGLRRPRPGKLKDVAEFGFEFIRYIDEHLHTA